MKLLPIILVTFVSFIPLSKGYQQKGIIEEVASLLRSPNSKGISKYFAPTLEMDVLSDEKSSSKMQAGAILDNFLSKHVVSSVKIIHRIDSKPDYKIAVVLMNTDKGNFRASITMKDDAGKGFFITEIRIEYSQ